MPIKHRPDCCDPPPSDITPESVYLARREFIRRMAVGAATGTMLWEMANREAFAQQQGALAARRNQSFVVPEKPTSLHDATHYNNYYEFGTGKEDPARNAGRLRTRPWTVSVEGEVARPQTFDIDALLKLAPLEERIYRLRCVEGWSMVIPWVGYPFAEIIRRVQPNGHARFVQFVSLADERQMPGLRSGVLDWPYTEGLRIDEAAHPLTLLTLGMYGRVLPNQNGAPVRVVVPWKYGFKSAKSIVRIRFTRTQPRTAWNDAAPQEYGFYSNVNPDVDHPRWSQASERRIGEDGFFRPRRKTLPFNGYTEVAKLYAGMDLRRHF